jgi:hypothetical protein
MSKKLLTACEKFDIGENTIDKKEREFAEKVLTHISKRAKSITLGI